MTGTGRRPPRSSIRALSAMKLDIAAADQAAFVVTRRKAQIERVHAPARLAAIHDVSDVAPAFPVDVRVTGDPSRRLPGRDVRGDAGPLDLHRGVAVVDVGEMTPELAVLDPACNREVRAGSRFRRDPATSGHEVLLRALRRPCARDV